MCARTPLSRRIIAALLLMQLTACYSWRSTTISPWQVIAEEKPSDVRVTRTDGSQLTLVDPFIRNGSIVSNHGRIGASVLFSDVSTFEVKRLNAIGLSLLLTLTFGVVSKLDACSQGHCE